MKRTLLIEPRKGFNVMVALASIGFLVIFTLSVNALLSSRRQEASQTARQIQTPAPYQLSLAPTIATSQSEETTVWKVYKNERYGFEIKYPKGWFSYDEDKWEGDNKVSPCDSTSSPKSSVENTLILSREDLGRCVGFVVWEQWPGELIIKVNKEEWPTSPPYILGKDGAELIEVSGIIAVKYPFTEKSELPRKQATRIYINYDGKGYLIEFLQTDKKGNYDPIYDQIVSTLTFIE